MPLSTSPSPYHCHTLSLSLFLSLSISLSLSVIFIYLKDKRIQKRIRNRVTGCTSLSLSLSTLLILSCVGPPIKVSRVSSPYLVLRGVIFSLIYLQDERISWGISSIVETRSSVLCFSSPRVFRNLSLALSLYSEYRDCLFPTGIQVCPSLPYIQGTGL